MRRVPIRRRALLSPLLLAVAIACSAAATLVACGAATRVSLDDTWPETYPSYGAAHERWTRHDRLLNGLDFVVDVYATLKAPEFRAAYVKKRGDRMLLPAGERNATLQAERAAASEVWELELLVATGRTEWNDLQKGAKSMWRLALVGDDGREVLATAIKPDRRTGEELGVYYRHMSPFYRAYVVTFPKLAPDGKPLVSNDSPRLALKMGSGLGGLELVWSTQ